MNQGHRLSGIVLCAAAMFIAAFSGCTTTRYITPRPLREHALASTLNYFSVGGPEISERTKELLTRYDLIKLYDDEPDKALEKLQVTDLQNPQQLYAMAEIAYILGDRAKRRKDGDDALRYYGTALMASYRYLLSPDLADQRNVFDPQFRRAADLYNETLEDSLRLLCRDKQLRPGERYSIRSGQQALEVQTVARGKWQPEDFSHYEFVSDYRIQQLHNRHTTFGLGVPLIAVRPDQQQENEKAQYYPDGLSFAVTAMLRCPANEMKPKVFSTGLFGEAGNRPRMVTSMPPNSSECVLELYDPLSVNQVQLHDRWVPLETDLTTPLAFFLDSPQFRKRNMPTEGLLNPEKTQEARGLFMLEPLDPNRIPVLMVHGLWSSPLTWMDMFNDLRSFPEIRERYQFWFYCYPTGQPFWISAVQLRNDLKEMQQTFDPDRRMKPLDQMVLVGHSMGGLLSRLQTIDSRDDFWKIVSDRPPEEMKGETEDRSRLVSTLYFHPNSSVQRVITIGTPHRGSNFANGYTRWLGRKFINLPGFIRDTGGRLEKENPGFFKDTQLLTTTTSIDSLAPESPIFPVMLRSKKASWVKTHNIVGVVSDARLIGRLSARGDGIVTYDSAHLEKPEVESEVIVDADHSSIHTKPDAILEVRRILLEHLREVDSNDRVAKNPEPVRLVAPVSNTEPIDSLPVNESLAP